MENNLDENDIMHVYEWVDSINLSRPKKNISRDFSDGVLMAEMIKHNIPKLVELHNYQPANSTKQKKYNWTTLNNKVFKKIGFQLSAKEIDDIIAYKPMVIEALLKKVSDKLQKYQPQINEEEEVKNEQFGKNQYDYPQIESKEMFYQQQISERNNIIEEMKNALEITEMKLKKSEDDKNMLNNKLKEYLDKIKLNI